MKLQLCLQRTPTLSCCPAAHSVTLGNITLAVPLCYLRGAGGGSHPPEARPFLGQPWRKGGLSCPSQQALLSRCALANSIIKHHHQDQGGPEPVMSGSLGTQVLGSMWVEEQGEINYWWGRRFVGKEDVYKYPEVPCMCHCGSRILYRKGLRWQSYWD